MTEDLEITHVPFTLPELWLSSKGWVLVRLDKLGRAGWQEFWPGSGEQDRGGQRTGEPGGQAGPWAFKQGISFPVSSQGKGGWRTASSRVGSSPLTLAVFLER